MPSSFLDLSVQIALLFISASFLITVFKVIKGPTLPDRVLALDLLVGAAIGFIAVLGIKTGFTLYLDIAIALGLVGFLATVAFARFILARGQSEETGDEDAEPLSGSLADTETVKETTKKRTSTKKRAAGNRKSAATTTSKRAATSKSKPKAKS